MSICFWWTYFEATIWQWRKFILVFINPVCFFSFAFPSVCSVQSREKDRRKGKINMLWMLDDYILSGQAPCIIVSIVPGFKQDVLQHRGQGQSMRAKDTTCTLNHSSLITTGSQWAPGILLEFELSWGHFEWDPQTLMIHLALILYTKLHLPQQCSNKTDGGRDPAADFHVSGSQSGRIICIKCLLT